MMDMDHPNKSAASYNFFIILLKIKFNYIYNTKKKDWTKWQETIGISHAVYIHGGKRK